MEPRFRASPALCYSTATVTLQFYVPFLLSSSISHTCIDIAVLCTIFFYAQILHTQTPMPRILDFLLSFSSPDIQFPNMPEFVVNTLYHTICIQKQQIAVCAYVAKHIFSSVQMGRVHLYHTNQYLLDRQAVVQDTERLRTDGT